MANIIASGKTELASADFTVTAAVPRTVFLTATGGAPPTDARVAIQIKSAGAVYLNVGVVDWKEPAKILVGAGTFRAVRQAGATDYAVDLE